MKMMTSIIARIIVMDKWIYLRQTGSTAELAAKIGCKPRSVNYYIKYMNKILAPHNVIVFFNHEENTYQYSVQGSLQNLWIWKPDVLPGA